MKRILMASTATLVAVAFDNGTCEVVYVEGKNGPTRVNKSDFDADQEKPAGERQYKAYKGKDVPEQSSPGGEQLSGPPLAAPSAPHFGEQEDQTNIDPLKQAVAPPSHAPDARLVLKEGSKFFVVNGAGEKVKDEGVDEGGYKTEDLAWKAIKDLPH